MARKARKTTNYMGADVTIYQSIDPAVTSRFVGYEYTKYTSEITVLTTEDEIVEALVDGQQGTIFVNETPFYATSGGQEADTGVIVCGDSEFAVKDTIKLLGGKIGHVGVVTKGMFKVGDRVGLRSTTRNAALRRRTTVPPICFRRRFRWCLEAMSSRPALTIMRNGSALTLLIFPR